ncbi:hypothetical protein [Desulfosarcina cetonica]|uniref:hypothetical protein n=1 Tax=Desulfosarcina cetonica TaxID=90730 RepID=UPI001FEF8A5C|nr:hypothetical protein [Desulfosarcina cetonica]
MRLDNVTDMVAGYTMGMKPDGRELLVVCVKATYDFPNSGEVPRLSKNQLPLVQADTFTGDPACRHPWLKATTPTSSLVAISCSTVRPMLPIANRCAGCR